MSTSSAKSGDPNLEEQAQALLSSAGREVLAQANAEGHLWMQALGDRLDDAALHVAEAAVAAAPSLPQLATVSAGLHSAAEYLRDHDPAAVIGDVDQAIRRHPYRAVAVAAGVGYLVARWLRSGR